MLVFVTAVGSTFVNRMHAEFSLHLTLPSMLPAFVLGTCLARAYTAARESRPVKRQAAQPLALCGLFLSLYCALVMPNDYSLVLIRCAVWLPLLVTLWWSRCFLIENSLLEYGNLLVIATY